MNQCPTNPQCFHNLNSTVIGLDESAPGVPSNFHKNPARKTVLRESSGAGYFRLCRGPCRLLRHPGFSCSVTVTGARLGATRGKPLGGQFIYDRDLPNSRAHLRLPARLSAAPRGSRRFLLSPISMQMARASALRRYIYSRSRSRGSATCEMSRRRSRRASASARNVAAISYARPCRLWR